uniref:Uncharacterized protein n=1 Tax=Peronospora matthiolae TaxID=2874970 RepID=A0AAV1T5M1_9STRA
MRGDVALDEEHAAPGGAVAMSTVHLACYSDSYYAADKVMRTSNSGAFAYVGNVPVVWQAKQQSAMELSMAEAGFVVAAVGMKRLIGVHNLLERGKHARSVADERVFGLQAAIEQLANEATSSVQKHVDVHVKLVRERWKEGL